MSTPLSATSSLPPLLGASFAAPRKQKHVEFLFLDAKSLRRFKAQMKKAESEGYFKKR